jgi:serine/threonine-protein kinase RsbW
MSEILTTTITNKISELPCIAETVRSFLENKQLSPETIDSVQLVLDELLSNVILWGYEDYLEHQIQIMVAVVPTQVQVVIEDDGREFDPTTMPSPDVLLEPERRSEGGLGLHLVRTMVDNVSYKRVDGRNVIEVRIATE